MEMLSFQHAKTLIFVEVTLFLKEKSGITYMHDFLKELIFLKDVLEWEGSERTLKTQRTL